MLAGAAAEALAGNRFAIGNSLERVQGPHRLVLEQYRSAARQGIAQRPARLQPPEPRKVQITGYADDASAVRQRVLVPLERFIERREQQSENAPNSAGGAPRTAPAGAATPSSNGKPVNQPGTEDPFLDDVPQEGQTPRLQPGGAPPLERGL
jgi:hypothetical protein